MVYKYFLKKFKITVIRAVADDVGILVGSCHAMFMDVLGMKREAEKVVPKLILFEQKQHRMDIACA